MELIGGGEWLWFVLAAQSAAARQLDLSGASYVKWQKRTHLGLQRCNETPGYLGRTSTGKSARISCIHGVAGDFGGEFILADWRTRFAKIHKHKLFIIMA